MASFSPTADQGEETMAAISYSSSVRKSFPGWRLLRHALQDPTLSQGAELNSELLP
jgi:hypothetical protein